MDGRIQYSIEADSANLNSAVKGALGGIGQLGTSIAATAAKYGLLSGAAGAAAGLGFGLKVAAEREQIKISFKNIIGDAKEADRVLAELFDFANVTPFESDEILGAARKLLAAGVATTDLKSELTALGNVSAGVGTDLGGLATIYSQISDKGKVMAEELMQFGERGAGAIKDQLAKSLGVTKAELMDMTSQGLVSFDQFRTALMQLAGETGRWGNLMAEQSQSTIGLWSSLKDAVTAAMNELGQPLNDAIKPILSDAIGLAGELKPVMADIGSHVGKAVKAMRDFVADAGKGGSVVSNLMTALSEAFGNVWSYLEPVVGGMATVAIGFGQALLTAVAPMGAALYAACEAAGYAIKAILLETMSELPGMGHLKVLAGGATFAGKAAVKRSEAYFQDAEGSGGKAMDIVADSIKKAGDDVRKSWETARKHQKAEDSARAVDAAEAQAGIEEANRTAADFGADIQSQKNAGNRTPAGAFGSDDPAKAAEDAGKAMNQAGKEAGSIERAKAGDALKKVERSASAAAGSLGQVASTASKDREGGPSGRIKGGSQMRLAQGDNARSQWGRLNEKEKQRYGNDAGRWMSESAQGGAAWRTMQNARSNLQREGKWSPMQYQGNFQSRASEAVGAGRPTGPQRGQAQGGGQAPAAQTQDSSQRVLLQGILAEMRRMTQHLGSLTQG